MNNIEVEIKKNFKFIKYVCYKYAVNKGDTNLLMSDVLYKCWLYKHNFDGVNFKAWISIVIKNSYIDYYRKIKGLGFYDISEMEVGYKNNIIDQMDNKVFLIDLFKSIENNFSVKYVEVFKLFIVDGLKLQEISDELQIPIGSAKLIVHRVRNFCLEYKVRIENKGVLGKIKRLNKEKVLSLC